MAEATRRGRILECLHCKSAGRQYQEVRYRLAAHVYKHHLALDKAPFYCTLCLLRCSSRSALMNHVTRYSRHRAAAKDLNFPDNSRFLIENPTPTELQVDVDYRELPAVVGSPALSLPVSEDVSLGGWELGQGTSIERSSADTSLATSISCPAPISAQNLITPQTGGSLVNVQLTPEMLAVLLSHQTRNVKAAETSVLGMQPHPVAMVTSAQASHQLYTPTPSLNSSHPVYTPTPIASRLSSDTGSAVKTTTSVFSTIPRVVASPVIAARPMVNTPQPSATPENILPQLLGVPDDNTTDYDLGFGEDWLEDPVLPTLQSGSLEALCAEKTPCAPMVTKKTQDEPAASATTEPACKRARTEAREQTEKRAVADDTMVKTIGALIEKSVKDMVDAMDRNSRAIRCVDKTMGEFREVVVKMNRTIERVGEEQRREHERRREEERQERTERRVEKSNTITKAQEESRKDRRTKENQPLKSVVNRK